jgi:hypothetical protein
MRSATQDLMDVRAKTYDGTRLHPVIGGVEDYLRGLDWVAEAGARARDEGHVFHVECFVVPATAANHRSRPSSRRAQHAPTSTGECWT